MRAHTHGLNNVVVELIIRVNGCNNGQRVVAASPTAAAAAISILIISGSSGRDAAGAAVV
jgi:hypothetical protein